VVRARPRTSRRRRSPPARECAPQLRRAHVSRHRPADALDLHKESVAIARRLDDPSELAASLRSHGTALQDVDVVGARQLLDESLELFERAGDEPGQAWTLHLLGDSLRNAGQWDETAALLERSIALSRRRGAVLWVGLTTHSLADLELDRGKLERAATLYRECLHHIVECRLERHKVYCIAGLAAVAALRRQDDLAVELWQAVHRAEQTLDIRLGAGERRRYEARLERLPIPQQGAIGLDEAVALALRDRP
jgi:tetratricopeptide (TPR) repeat protein